MKIAIPIENNSGLQSALYGHFGSAPFYALYETESQALNIITNTTMEHQHGQCHPAQALVKEKITTVICRGMGLRAIQNLNALGIRIFLSRTAVDVAGAITEFTSGQAELMAPDMACQVHAHEGHNCQH